MNTKALGDKAELFSVKYLKKCGCKILERNFKVAHAEIDIIAKDGGYIVFVEVKSRSSEAFGLPREAVNEHKRRSVVSASKIWLYANNLTGAPVRYDVIDILNGELTHLKDAFRP